MTDHLWKYAIAASLVAVPAYAQRQEPNSANSASVRTVEAPFSGAPMADEQLGRIAGRQDTSLVAEANQTAEVTRTTVGDNVVTGDITLADNALQNLSGLAVVTFNSGNNVAVNSSLNVNIALPTQ
jgi:hypothetical protein